MESLLAFFTLFSLLLFTSITDARKDPAEYWNDVMKDQPMPESIQGLLHSNPKSLSKEKTNCHTSLQAQKKDDFTKDFDHQPNISSYHDDVEPKEDKAFLKDFEPRPNISTYHNDVKPEDEKSFVNDFEPGPNISVYHE